MWLAGNRIRGMAVVALTAALAGCAAHREFRSDQTVPPEALLGARVALPPVADYSGGAAADSLLASRLTAALKSTGAEVFAGSRLRPLLRRHRIRSQGMVGRQEALVMAEALALDRIVLASWDVVRTGLSPEVGLSLRLLDPRAGGLLAAVSIDATGLDGAGLLGTGVETDPGRVADAAVAQAVEDLAEAAARTRAGDRDRPTLAVVPLDNLAGIGHAGEVGTVVLVSALMASGFPVLEPGFLRAWQRDHEIAFRGAFGAEALRELREEWGVQAVVTGTMDIFEPAVGDPAVSVPRVALGLRAVDTATGQVILARELEGRGDDDDGWFQQGRIHGVTGLVMRLNQRFVQDLDRSFTHNTRSDTP